MDGIPHPETSLGSLLRAFERLTLGRVSRDLEPRKKHVVVVMNCAGEELLRYLQSSQFATNRYRFTYFPVHQGTGADKKRALYVALADADVVVAQNVSFTPWLRNENMKKAVKRGCRFFEFAFWRCDAYWPIKLERFSESLWFLPLEFGEPASFHRYIRSSVPSIDIHAKYDEQMQKFATIESTSELKMLPFVLEHYRHFNLFSDYWHPSSIFFFKVAQYVLSQLGLPADIDLFPNNCINKNRYRFVLDDVSHHLGLNYPQDIFNFNEHLVTREAFFEFCKFARHQLSPQAREPDVAATLFNRWIADHRLDAKPFDLARHGTQSQTNYPVDDDVEELSLHALDVGVCMPKATGRDEAATSAWWLVDLGEFRQISAISVWSSCFHDHSTVELIVLLSTDGQVWRNAGRGLGARLAKNGTKVDIALSTNLVFRYLRVSARQPRHPHFDRIEVFANVVGL